MSVFIPISRKGNAKDCSDYCTIAAIPHENKVVLKICPARLQQYVNQELSNAQAGLRKWKGTRDQSANICWIMVKAREFQKNIYFCFIDYAKVFDCVQVIGSVMSNSVRSHRWQPTRLPHPWDFPGKNTGVGCHFLLQCMKVKSESEVTQSCPTLPLLSFPNFLVH